MDGLTCAVDYPNQFISAFRWYHLELIIRQTLTVRALLSMELFSNIDLAACHIISQASFANPGKLSIDSLQACSSLTSIRLAKRYMSEDLDGGVIFMWLFMIVEHTIKESIYYFLCACTSSGQNQLPFHDISFSNAHNPFPPNFFLPFLLANPLPLSLTYFSEIYCGLFDPFSHNPTDLFLQPHTINSSEKTDEMPEHEAGERRPFEREQVCSIFILPTFFRVLP